MTEGKSALFNRLKFNLTFLNRHKHLVGHVMRRFEITDGSMIVDMVLMDEFMQDYATDCMTPCSVSIEIPQNYYSVSAKRTVTVNFVESGVTIEQAELNESDMKSLYSIIEKMLQICAFKFLKH